jgi:diguanylate cyclase (GGDEF)-like protein
MYYSKHISPTQLKAIAETIKNEGYDIAWSDFCTILAGDNVNMAEIFRTDMFCETLLYDVKESFCKINNDIKQLKLLWKWLEDKSQLLIDDKTPLLSKKAAIDLLYKICAKSKYIGCIYIDITKFKVFNDAFDHIAGDEYIRVVGSVIKKCIKSDNSLAVRDGGDEYYVFVRGDNKKTIKTQLAEFVTEMSKELSADDTRKKYIDALKEKIKSPTGNEDLKSKHILVADKDKFLINLEGRVGEPFSADDVGLLHVKLLCIKKSENKKPPVNPKEITNTNEERFYANIKQHTEDTNEYIQKNLRHKTR